MYSLWIHDRCLYIIFCSVGMTARTYSKNDIISASNQQILIKCWGALHTNLIHLDDLNFYKYIYKYITKLILLYLPNKYSIYSTKEFIKILQSNKPNYDTVLSLDIGKSLCQHPVKGDNDKIRQSIYKHSLLSPPNIKTNFYLKFFYPKQHKYYFYDPNRHICSQTAAITMGSSTSPIINHVVNKNLY